MLPTRECGFRPQASTFQFPVIIQTIHNRIAGNLHARENERIFDALNWRSPRCASLDVHGERQLSTSDFWRSIAPISSG